MNNTEMYRWIEVLGWTLLHSLWQGLVIGILFLALRRIIHSTSPTLKYAISIGSLFLILVSVVITFFYLLPIPIASVTGNQPTLTEWTLLPTEAWPLNTGITWPAFAAYINDYLPALVAGWLMGMFLFGFRLVITASHTIRLRRHAQYIGSPWKEKLRELAVELGVARNILLAESLRVDAPVLLGYFKPIILLPVGMISGLTPEQVETILLHELAHIRRHDFAVNLVQSVIEVVFFFNPFVWIISARIRTDREHCCDDTVVAMKSPLIYAHALHHLAEAQTQGTSFSLGITGTENKLFQRIRRIMKTSEKNEENRGKVLPAVVVMMALALASWVSIQAHRPERNGTSVTLNPAPVSDTSKKDVQAEKQQSMHRQTITTLDEKGEPHTQIIEWSDGAESDIEALEPVEAVPAMEVVPAVEPFEEPTEVTDVPAVDDWVASIDASVRDSYRILRDTFPNNHARQSGIDREEWEKEFTQKFRERFSDFYEKNGAELQKLLSELDRNLRSNNNQNIQREMNKLNQELQRLAPLQADQMKVQVEKMKEMSDHLRDKNAVLASKMKVHASLMKEREMHMRSLGQKMKFFEKELTQELVNDGYFGKDEKINSIDWHDEGAIKVNGKKIKEPDQQKYNDLHKKYFKEGSKVGLAE